MYSPEENKVNTSVRMGENKFIEIKGKRIIKSNDKK